MEAYIGNSETICLILFYSCGYFLGTIQTIIVISFNPEFG